MRQQLSLLVIGRVPMEMASPKGMHLKVLCRHADYAVEVLFWSVPGGISSLVYARHAKGGVGWGCRSLWAE